ncbi:hypothetical protein QWY28_09545 [Nocardioides sp. SOB77]|uniref:Endonuclease/exonuclease/phosphatase domain-containing protein n=1 Tax=Nocardioides oceani TaxID=3058369 RepID=A0ABT8FF81_9ACTN|nr:endonuclease/exonuclease/phosphatase family protein [Nocardioides oceani]MDN4173185.1 hypothetical protein [Nocardioides oceani]
MGVPVTVRRGRRRPARRVGLARALAAGTAATLLGAVLAVPAGAATGGAARPSPTAGVSVTDDVTDEVTAEPAAPFRAFTLNVCYCLSPAKAMADVRRVLPLADAGGLQEFSDAVDRANLITLLTAEDWGWYMPTTGGATIPIIWDRSRFRLLEGNTIKVHPSEKGVTPARYINSVRLREIATGEVYALVNAHTIARASHDARLTDMRRIPRLRKHLQLLRGEIERLFGTTEHVFAGGDLNVNYLADRNRRLAGLPTNALGDLVRFDMPLVGSRGTRSLLDYTMTVRSAGGLVPTDQRVVRGFASDHDAVVVTYQPQQLLADGPVFNDPTADPAAPAAGTAVRDRQVRAVRNAEPGDTVRLATARLDDPVLEEALLAAALEGVQVRVVTGAVTPALTRIQAALGTDTAAASYALACPAACLDGGRHEVEALLVDRLARTTDLTVVASAAAVPASTTAWTTGFVSTDPATYETYGAVLDRLVAAAGGAPEPLPAADVPATEEPAPSGAVPALTYPVTAGATDPVLDALAPVGCAGTTVRAVVRSWAGARGRAVADRLAALRTAGCDVAVVVGSGVLSGVTSRLTAAGVAVTVAKVAQTTLVVSGGDVTRAWVGGPPWTDRGLTSTGLALEVSDPAVVDAYVDAFDRIAPPA